MPVLLLIRHASHDLLDRVLAGNMPGVHLNALGLAQAAALGERLASGLAAVYSSPLERARETAAPIARRAGCALAVRDDLAEIRFGEWTGRSFRELDALPAWRAWNERRSLVRPPGGETMLEVQARVVTALAALAAAHPGRTVAVVGHSDPLRAAIAHHLGVPLDLMLRFDLAPASITTLELTGTHARLVALNDTHGLPEPAAAAPPGAHA